QGAAAEVAAQASPEPAEQTPAAPAGPRSAVTAEPRAAAGADDESGPQPLLSVRGVSMHFPVKKGMFARARAHVRAVDEVDLDILPGQTMGLVGESGCGKTTLGRAITRAIDPTAGQLRYSPDGSPPVDLAS